MDAFDNSRRDVRLPVDAFKPLNVRSVRLGVIIESAEGEDAPLINARLCSLDEGNQDFHVVKGHAAELAGYSAANNLVQTLPDQTFALRSIVTISQHDLNGWGLEVRHAPCAARPLPWRNSNTVNPAIGHGLNESNMCVPRRGIH
ncbi:hypothetical protein CBM2585_A80137 [Cupriavidus taiwanensis]|nr:hypothetical protein CBM2585_A80137 [Cupriavidus taiwanensis]